MLSLSKKLPKRPCFCYNRRNGGVYMEGWRKDARHEPIIVDLEALVPTERGKEIYAMRKQTIERVFADAKEKHAMRYTHHRGLARVSAWVRLKYAAMNLKKLAQWSWKSSILALMFVCYHPNYRKTPAFAF